jgi:uncharacterized damage-inducible protein DinB
MSEKKYELLLKSAEASPQQVAMAVSGLSPKELGYKPSPGKWSILEILAHLADVEIVFAYRLRGLLVDKTPAIRPFDQEEWANHLGYAETSAPEMVAQYALLRRSNLRLFRRLSTEDWLKGAIHPEFNRNFTVGDLLERMVDHSASHLKQIEALKRQAPKG